MFLTYRVVLQAGAFELTGFDVALTVSGGLVALPNGIQATRATARASVTRATAAASAVRSTSRTDTTRTTSTAAATRTTTRATVERTT